MKLEMLLWKEKDSSSMHKREIFLCGGFGCLCVHSIWGRSLDTTG